MGCLADEDERPSGWHGGENLRQIEALSRAVAVARAGAGPRLRYVAVLRYSFASQTGYHRSTSICSKKSSLRQGVQASSLSVNDIETVAC
jgi:hypothetical protein